MLTSFDFVCIFPRNATTATARQCKAIAIKYKKYGQAQRVFNTETSLPTDTAKSGTTVEPSSKMRVVFVDFEASHVYAQESLNGVSWGRVCNIAGAEAAYTLSASSKDI